MHDEEKTQEQLIRELARLRQRVRELEESQRKTSDGDKCHETTAKTDQSPSYALLEATIDSLPVDFFALGPDGRYILQSSVSRRQNGDVVGKRPEDVAPNAETLAIWLDNNRRAFAGEVVTGEMELRLPSGEIRQFRNILTPLRKGAESFGILGINIDVTEQLRAERELKQYQQHLEELVSARAAELEAIYEGMVDGLLIADLQTKQFRRANTAMCRMIGYSEAELLSMSVRDIHPPEELPDVHEKFRVRSDGAIVVTENRAVVRKDGTVFYADITARRITYQTRPCLIGFFRDITERKKAQEALWRERQTLWHMLRSSDHERQIIAYEIHDGLAQQLAAALMQFQTNEHLLRQQETEKSRTAYQAGVEMVRQAHFEARRLISGVRPPILDESGVEAAIAHLVHDHRAPNAPKIEFRSDVRFGRLPRTLENAIYRIAQEALTNACKHSQSESVCVTLQQQGDRIHLAIEDWGVGFDVSAVRQGHFGLEGIRERARLLGGQLSIESRPGQGTHLRVELPLLERDEVAM